MSGSRSHASCKVTSVSTTTYRIAEEALRNVTRHACKTHVKVVLEGTQVGLRLSVRDFGEGFDPKAEPPRRRMGLVSMAERARRVGGTLAIRSALREGTTVEVEVPLPIIEGS